MRLLILVLLSVILFGCAQTPAPEAPAGEQQGLNATGDETAQPSAQPPEEVSGPAPAPPAAEPIQETKPPEPEKTYSLASEEMVFTAGAWDIHGTYYKSQDKDPRRAVILLPMLGQDRDSYPMSFISKLHDAMPDAAVLSLDPRGHGESTNIGTWESFDLVEFKAMRTDVVAAMDSLDDQYPTIREYHIVGASMGSSTAILAGEQISNVNSLVVISPGLEYRGVKVENSAEDYIKPVLIVTSRNDEYSYSSALTLKDKFGSNHKVLKIYAGSAHGTDLFQATEDDLEPLNDLILNFLK